MTIKDDSRPAFPAPTFAVPSELSAEKILQLKQLQGMSLRDWLAGHALASMLTWVPDGPWPEEDLTDDAVLQARAEWAYRQADAMLEAGKK